MKRLIAIMKLSYDDSERRVSRLRAAMRTLVCDREGQAKVKVHRMMLKCSRLVKPRRIDVVGLLEALRGLVTYDFFCVLVLFLVLGVHLKVD